MKKITLLLLLFGVFIFAKAQADTLNQYDANGKKNGKWILYYNEYWKVVNDSSKACYYAYTYYDHGMRTITEATWGSKEGKLIDSSTSNSIGKIKLLDGKYTWYDKKGRKSSIHYFNHGEFVT